MKRMKRFTVIALFLCLSSALSADEHADIIFADSLRRSIASAIEAEANAYDAYPKLTFTGAEIASHLRADAIAIRKQMGTKP